jgi:transposase
VPILPAAGRHDLADDEWRVLEALLPRGKKPGRTPRWSRRQRNRMLGPSGPVTPSCRHDTCVAFPRHAASCGPSERRRRS